MLASICAYLRRHHLALVAILLSTGGTAYAATRVTSADIADGTIRSVDVRNGSLRGGDLARGTVGARELGARSVGASELAASAISSRTVRVGALAGDRLAPLSVGADRIAPGAVGAGQIAPGGVGASELATGAVGAAQLAPGAVGSAQLASGAVGSGQLAPNAVGSGQLADGAITPAKLAFPLAAHATSAEDAVSVAGVAPVPVAEEALSTSAAGGLLLGGSLQLADTSGSPQDVSVTLTVDGSQPLGPYVTTLPAGASQAVPLFAESASLAAGTHTVTLTVQAPSGVRVTRRQLVAFSVPLG